MTKTNLPYHCPTLHGDFYRPPCERQIAEAKEKRAKNPHAMLGFLEKCLGCGGKELMQREGAAFAEMVRLGTTLPEKDSEVQRSDEMAGNVQRKTDKDEILLKSVLDAIDAFQLKGVIPNRMELSEYLEIKPYKIDLLIKELRNRGEIEVVPDSWPNQVKKPVIISPTTNEVAKINMPSDCQNEKENMTEIMTGQDHEVSNEEVRKTYMVPELPKDAKNIHGNIHDPPKCPKHPGEPQIQCGPKSKRPGAFMGACKVCMAERRMKVLASKGQPAPAPPNNPAPTEIPNRTPPASNLPQYPIVMVYAVDWHQYSGQHDPKSGEPYKAIKGWMVGFLLEETEDHLAIVHTAFETGDVRYVVVVPKCAVISKHILETP